MRKLSLFLLTVIALTGSVNVLFAQQEKQERKAIPGMGNLLMQMKLSLVITAPVWCLKVFPALQK